MSLADIFQRHGSDKWKHGYAAVYERLTPPQRLLEVGVLDGASLGAWVEWWPLAFVYGMDTFKRRPKPRVGASVKLISRDSTMPWRGVGAPFGLIVDDGDHNPASQLATFRNLWPHLARGGTYCIEDVWLDLAHWWPSGHGYRREDRDALLAEGFEVHDLRAGHQPDSVLLCKVKA